ncbi:hypothetical protein AVEN_50152-1 [Araneus ventricosus]|uniref:Uncharacterized protein n=1 Tax=Araneus ventricosus TaxID=182803 RepID=A0A4Y2TPR0_ARAVE|nr:hypothetical protein AVEN_50152-1 [Araneus ventricosus]
MKPPVAERSVPSIHLLHHQTQKAVFLECEEVHGGLMVGVGLRNRVSILKPDSTEDTPYFGPLHVKSNVEVKRPPAGEDCGSLERELLIQASSSCRPSPVKIRGHQRPALVLLKTGT